MGVHHLHQTCTFNKETDPSQSIFIREEIREFVYQQATLKCIRCILYSQYGFPEQSDCLIYMWGKEMKIIHCSAPSSTFFKVAFLQPKIIKQSPDIKINIGRQKKKKILCTILHDELHVNSNDNYRNQTWRSRRHLKA